MDIKRDSVLRKVIRIPENTNGQGSNVAGNQIPILVTTPVDSESNGFHQHNNAINIQHVET